jgi:hypothetical protein
MLGLASALTTGSAHEQMYSLLLDGTGDYLDTGSSFQSTMQGSFSWSFWAKPDDGQPGGSGNMVFLGTDNNADQDALYITLGSNGKILVNHEANNDPANYTTDGVVFPNGATDWTHICVTVTKDTNTSYIIYVDGAAVAGTLSNAVDEEAHAAWASSDNFYIGALNDDGTATRPITSKMDEVALFNVALDAAAVTAIYNSGKPFDLNNNRGNYDNSSALVAYWRMFNGPFDDKANGAVHDAHNPGFGAEIVTNGTFDSDLTGWTASDTDTENTIVQADGKVVITSDGSTPAVRLKQAGVFVVGKTYKVEFDAYDITGAGLKIQSADNANISAILADGHYTKYHVATGTVLNIYRFVGGSASAGKLDNISVKLLNGFPGLTAADATFSTDTPDD